MQEKQPMSGLQFCADVFNFKSSQLFLVERCWSIFNLKKKGHILVIVSGSWCAVRLWHIQQKRCSPCSNLVSVYPSCLHTSSSYCALCTSLLPWWTLMSWAAVWSEDEPSPHTFGMYEQSLPFLELAPKHDYRELNWTLRYVSRGTA